MRGPHDIGGLDAGAVDTDAHPMTFWEKQIDALNQLMAQKGYRKTDENRRYIEQLGHDEQAHRNPNYQRLVRNAILWAAGSGAH